MTQRNFVIPEILHQDVQNCLGSKRLPGMRKKSCHSERREKSHLNFNCLAYAIGVTVFRESPSLAAKYFQGTYARKTVTPSSLPQLKCCLRVDDSTQLRHPGNFA